MEHRNLCFCAFAAGGKLSTGQKKRKRAERRTEANFYPPGKGQTSRPVLPGKRAKGITAKPSPVLIRKKKKKPLPLPKWGGAAGRTPQIHPVKPMRAVTAWIGQSHRRAGKWKRRKKGSRKTAPSEGMAPFGAAVIFKKRKLSGKAETTLWRKKPEPVLSGLCT